MVRFEYERDPGAVFFNPEAKGVSHYGTFPSVDATVWSDERISDFIRGGRPGLFRSLQRLPLSSMHLPEKLGLGAKYLTPDERVLVKQIAPPDTCNNQAASKELASHVQSQHTRLYRGRTFELQHKRYMQACILGKLTTKKRPHHSTKHIADLFQTDTVSCFSASTSPVVMSCVRHQAAAKRSAEVAFMLLCVQAQASTMSIMASNASKT